MRKLTFILSLIFFLAAPAMAAETSASDQSIKQLLEIMEARKLVDSMTQQMERTMKLTTQRALQGRTVTPEQQEIIDRMRTQTVALLKEDLNWETLEDLYVRIYRESFSQEEIDGLLDLYKTPAGQTLIKKMPDVMQRSMAEMQMRMGPIMQKMQKIQQDAFRDLKAQAKK